MILLTGATGLVGRQVEELLRARGIPVVALVRDPRRASWLADRGARLLSGSVSDPATWDRVSDVSAVVHCAAVIAGGRTWAEYSASNIESTRLAAQRARLLGVPLVHLSSVAVYGRSTMEPVGTVTEDFPFAPLGEGAWYGRSKRESEQVVWQEAEKGLRAIALRPCVIYGPHDRFFFPSILAKARRGFLPLIGRGDRPMALVHARSVAEGVLAALDSKTGWGRPYNITGDGPIAPRDVVAALGRGLGKKVFSPRIPEMLALATAGIVDVTAGLLLPAGRFPGTLRTAVGYWRGGDPYRSDAARAVLGWKPTIDHASEIERLAKEFKL